MGDYEVFPIAEDLSSYAFPPKRASRRSERTLYMPLAKRIQLSSGTGVESSSEAGLNPSQQFATSQLARLMRRSREHDLANTHLPMQHSSNTNNLLGELVFVVEQPLSGLPLVDSLFTQQHSPSLTQLRPSPSPDSCSNIQNNNVPSNCPNRGDGERSRGESAEDKGAFSDELEDAEFTASVLNNLPTSYDDFESKELHLKLERNISSPLVSSQSPATDCGRLSAASSSTIASPMHPILDSSNMQPDAEDLEVAMINESFEEQQKQTKLYENPGLKDLFYSRPNVADDPENTAMHTSRNRLPYGAVLPQGTEVAGGDKQASGATVDLSKRYIPHADHRFTPVRASNASELGEEDRASCTDQERCLPERRPFDPLFRNVDSSDAELETGFDDVLDGADADEFDVEEMILDESTLRRASRGSAFDTFNELQSQSDGILKQSRRDFMKAQRSAPMSIQEIEKVVQSGSAEDKMDATEALAMDVVESLFSGSVPMGQRSPCTPNQGKMLEPEKPEGSVLFSAPPAQSVDDAYRSSLADGTASGGVSGEKKTKKTNAEQAPVDSWEELDSEDFDLKVVGIKSAMEKVNIGKQKVDYLAPPVRTTIPWDDKELPHVLELYALPARCSLDDVKSELAKLDLADVTFQKVNDTSYLLNFPSLSAALKARVEMRQSRAGAWLHLRGMSDACDEAQQVARKYAAHLKPHKPRPRTTALVARRLVEGALGVRAPVSREQRNSERKVISEAREQRKAVSALWGDNP